MKLKTLRPLIVMACMLFAFEAPAQTLWYRQSAGSDWNSALPVGNGRLGAMVYGGVTRERLQLNEDTVWEGYKRDGANSNALTALPEVRRLLFAGKNEEASDLAAKTRARTNPLTRKKIIAASWISIPALRPRLTIWAT